MSPAFLLALGVLCALLGGELFVRGATGLARLARVPAHLIGVTVAALATSSPELAVAVGAGVAGVPAIALGDVVGTNVANVGLILGTALLISGMSVPRDSVRRDFPVALLTPLATLAVVLDGMFSRVDAGLFLALFAVWLATVVREARPLEQPSWGQVRQEIALAFTRHATLDANRVQVEVEGGVVTLRGTLRSWAERQDAENAAWAVPGVHQAHNEPSISPP